MEDPDGGIVIPFAIKVNSQPMGDWICNALRAELKGDRPGTEYGPPMVMSGKRYDVQELIRLGYVGVYFAKQARPGEPRHAEPEPPASD